MNSTLSFRAKLSISLLLLALLPVLTACVFLFLASKDYYEKETRLQLDSHFELMASELEIWIKEGRQALGLAIDEYEARIILPQLLEKADSPERKRAADYLHDKLRAFVKAFPNLSSVALLHPDTGRVLLSTDRRMEGRERGQEAYFREGRKGQYIAPVSYSVSREEPQVVMTAPVKGEAGALLGVVAVELNPKDLNQILQAHTQGREPSYRVYVIDQYKYFVTLPANFGGNPLVHLARLDLERLGQSHERRTSEYASYDGRQVLGAYRWFPEGRLGLFVEIETARIAGKISYVWTLLLGMCAGAAVLALLVARGIFGFLMRPLGEVAEVAHALQRGEYDRRLTVAGGDELGGMAQSINDMADSLRLSHDRLEGMVEDRTRELKRELAVRNSLAELSQTLLDPAQGVREMAEKVLAHAQRLTDSAHGFVSEIDLLNGDNVGHTLTAMLGTSCLITGPEQRIAFSRHPDGHYPRLWGHALNTGKPFFVNDPYSHPHFVGLPQGHVPLEAFLSVPVKFAGEVVGQIALANPGLPYRERDLEVVGRLGELYAVAIHNSREEAARLRLENQIRQAQKLEAIGTLAGGIAHDFNNILGAIIGYTQLVQERLAPGDELNAEDLGEVLTAANRAKELVRQILLFSRRGEEKKRPVRIGEVVEEATRLLRQTIPATIAFHRDIDPEAGCVLADATQIHQVVINLCTNAYQAMKESGGRLELALGPVHVDEAKARDLVTLRAGEYALLRVTDTGVGIPPEALARIFDPFFTTKGVGEGTGLGLALVHGIVQNHGGAVRVESTPGVGTTFRVYLPLTKPDASEELCGEEEASRAGMRRGLVLVVDDETSLVKLMRRFLESSGYEVEAYTSSVEALEAIERGPERLDLVITDQTMPGVTGEMLTRRVLELRPDLPVIICSGHSDILDESRAKGIGARALLEKPVDMHKLEELMGRLLNS